MTNTWYIIPARKGSKGLPLKNRKLVPIVFDAVGTVTRPQDIIFSSDDQILLSAAARRGFLCRARPDVLCTDTANMKEILLDVVEYYSLKDEDTLVCLYPTSPQRTSRDIKKALEFYNVNNLKSMLCRKKAKTHPYLCLQSSGNLKAIRPIDHELYRRQDYPECFEISHFMAITQVGELKNLCFQLYNSETGFMWIEDKVDVDSEKDFQQFLESRKAI